jgi:hypothetical protein
MVSGSVVFEVLVEGNLCCLEALCIDAESYELNAKLDCGVIPLSFLCHK